MGGSAVSDAGADERDRAEYDLMMELDRLESLREEMEELGVSTLAEIDDRMRELHRKLDEMELD